MSNEKGNNSDFTVLKHSYSLVTCSECNGSGIKRREFRKMKFVYNCHTCKGSGKETIKTTEEFPLSEAIKLIKSKTDQNDTT